MLDLRYPELSLEQGIKIPNSGAETLFFLELLYVILHGLHLSLEKCKEKWLVYYKYHRSPLLLPPLPIMTLNYSIPSWEHPYSEIHIHIDSPSSISRLTAQQARISVVVFLVYWPGGEHSSISYLYSFIAL